MPFINSKVTIAMSEEKKESVKTRLGQVIGIIPGKSENWLMVGFQDNYDLYFQGNNRRESAFIEVKLFGHASRGDYDEMTKEICKIFFEELGIEPNRIYVKYEETEHWGWNGENL